TCKVPSRWKTVPESDSRCQQRAGHDVHGFLSIVAAVAEAICGGGNQLQKKKGCQPKVGSPFSRKPLNYSVDSISNPQASRRGSGMYFEFLLRRAHSRRRVERTY